MNLNKDPLKNYSPLRDWKSLAKLVWICFVVFSLVSCLAPPSGSPRNIIILTQPPGAKTFLDDNFIGNTPLVIQEPVIENIEKSSKKISFSLPGYHLYQASLILTNLLSFKLVPLTKSFTLQFSKQPDSLFIDGKKIIPQKNMELDLSLEKHEILAYKKNFPFFKQTLTLREDTPSLIPLSFSTTLSKNQLQIQSLPSPAKIFFQAMELTETPDTFFNLSTEPFILTFKKVGYQDREIFVNLLPNEKKSMLVELDAQIKTFQINIEDAVEGSRLLIHDKVYQIDNHSISFPPGVYPYSIHHPNFYPVMGELLLSNDTKVSLKQRPLIPHFPKKLVERNVSGIEVSTARWQEDQLYLSDYPQQTIHVYDQSLNLLTSFSFAKVGNEDSPYLVNGFSGKDAFLLRNRMVFSQGVFQPVQTSENLSSHLALVSPIYVINVSSRAFFTQTPREVSSKPNPPNSSNPNPIPNSPHSRRFAIVLDNGLHQIKLLDYLSESRLLNFQPYPNFKNSIKAVDFWDDTIKDQYLLPLRFAQAIWVESQNQSRLIFTDIVNHNIKEYDWKNGKANYFSTSRQEGPPQPYAITQNHQEVLVASQQGGEIWVYDLKGHYLHSFDLQQPDLKIKFLFSQHDFLYVISEEKLLMYFLG